MKTNYKDYLTGSLSIITAIAGMCVSGVAVGGDITGKITLKGTPPPEKPIDASADPYCAKIHPNPKEFTTKHYVVAKDGGLANVFVYVKEGLGSTTVAPTGEAPILDQQGCFYKPYVLGVQVNQPLKIRNSDDTLHNVHALPKTNKEFNFAQPVKGMVTEKKFDKPEVLVKFKCDVHPWMFAFVGVVDHPFFAVTGPDGAFKIANLPPGKYTLEAVHPKFAVQTQEITVAAGAVPPVNFTFEVK